MRHISHRLHVLASLSRAAVLQGAIRLMPGIATPLAHEGVGNDGGQAVEHGVVRRALGAAQIGLAGPPRAELREAVGGVDQVAGVHGVSCSGGLVSFRLAYCSTMPRPAGNVRDRVCRHGETVAPLRRVALVFLARRIARIPPAFAGIRIARRMGDRPPFSLPFRLGRGRPPTPPAPPAARFASPPHLPGRSHLAEPLSAPARRTPLPGPGAQPQTWG